MKRTIHRRLYKWEIAAAASVRERVQRGSYRAKFNRSVNVPSTEQVTRLIGFSHYLEEI